MNALALNPPEAPPAPPALDQLLAGLLATDPGAEILSREPGVVRLKVGEAGATARMSLLLVDATDLDRLESAVDAERPKPGQTLHVVAVGGDPSVIALLKKLIPPTLMQVRAATHAHVWSPGRPPETVRGLALGTLQKAVKRVASGEALDLAAVTRTREGQQEEARLWLQPLLARKPWVTWTVAALSTALFGLQLWWGDGEPYASATRMGGGLGGLLGAGQWYRLFTPSLLHGSVPHLLLNMAALFSFGTFLERFLGWRRYLALYVLSAVGGSLASALHPEEVLSVGASGGIWGLMVAGAVLVTLPRGKLPALVSAQQRVRAWTPVGLNAFYSFQPGVDFLAHLGGGLTGALLIATGLLTWGIPRADEAADPARPPAREGLGVQALGLVCGVAMIAALAAALAQGRPWELRSAPTLQTVALESDPLQVQLPPVLGAHTVESRANTNTYVYGALRYDPVATVVTVVKQPLSAEEAKDERATLEAILAEQEKDVPLEGFVFTQHLRLEQQGARFALHGHETAADGRAGDEYFVVAGDRVVSLLVLTAANAPAEWKIAAGQVPYSVSPR